MPRICKTPLPSLFDLSTVTTKSNCLPTFTSLSGSNINNRSLFVLPCSAPKPATERILQLAIERALLIAGVNQRIPGLLKGKRREIAVSHGLRKLAITTMVTAGVKDAHRRYLTGHAQVGQDASYVLPTEEELLAECVKSIPLLTIDPAQRLKQENQELRKDYLAELGELREEFNEMKQMFVNLQRGTQRKLVNEFLQRTGDELQDEWWESEDKKYARN